MKLTACLYLSFCILSTLLSAGVCSSTLDDYLQKRQQVLLEPYGQILPALESANFDTSSVLGKYFYNSVTMATVTPYRAYPLTSQELAILKADFPEFYYEREVLISWYSDTSIQQKRSKLNSIIETADKYGWERLSHFAHYYLILILQGEGAFLNAVIKLHQLIGRSSSTTSSTYDWYGFPLIEMYNAMAQSAYGLKNDSEQLKYCTKIVEFISARAGEAPDYLAKALACKADIYIRAKNFEKARDTLKQLDQVYKNTRLPEVKVLSLIRFSIFYHAQQNYLLAFQYAEESLELQKQLATDIPNMIYTAYRFMTTAALGAGNLQQAAKYYLQMENSRSAMEQGYYFDNQAVILKARLELAKNRYTEAFALYERAYSSANQHLVSAVDNLQLEDITREINAQDVVQAQLKNQINKTQSEKMTLVAVFTTALVIVGGALVWYLVRHQQQLRAFARTDSLTRLYNRGHSVGLADNALSKATPNTPVCLALIDIDHFKQINDTLGHQVGDKVLEAVGKQLALWAGKNYLAGRYGGEEFLLILPDTSLDAAQAELARLRHLLENSVAQIKGPLTFSGGLVQAAQPADTDTVISLCDTLLYQAKQQGRNTLRSRQWPG